MNKTPCLKEAPSLQEQADNPEALNAEENTAKNEAIVTDQIKGDDPSSVAEINWEDYSNSFDTDLSFAHEAPPADAPSQFDFISATPGLDSYLMWQLTHLDLNEKDADLTQFIICNLDGHGFLEATHSRHSHLRRV